MHMTDERVAWDVLQELARLGWETGKTGTGSGGDGVVLEVRYAADPPNTAPCLVAGADASDAARAFLAQLRDRQG
jgi:hypothetical protein